MLAAFREDGTRLLMDVTNVAIPDGHRNLYINKR